MSGRNPNYDRLTITSKGFQFLLEDRQTQLWQILMFYLNLREVSGWLRAAELVSIVRPIRFSISGVKDLRVDVASVQWRGRVKCNHESCLWFRQTKDVRPRSSRYSSPWGVCSSVR
jgi:hypothetical protein